MEVLHKNRLHVDSFVRDYLNREKESASFFDYGFTPEEINRRFLEIDKKKDMYQKAALKKHLSTYNQSFLYHKDALVELDKLDDDRAVMVVGGQQAGLLTGPFYTISKAITIIKEAKKQEEWLQVPVIPVFWIAGEDHDWEEINHIYLPGNETVNKYTYEGVWKPGASVSEQDIDEETFEHWWETILHACGETEYTSDIYKIVRHLADRSRTFSDFFGETMRWLFRGTGLVMLDAHSPELRKLESHTFSELFSRQFEVQEAVNKGITRRKQSTYHVPQGLPEQDSIHLFYHKSMERTLLYSYDDGHVADKNHKHLFNKGDVLNEIHTSPERFSTNVFTRPIVQEKLLPVLSFVAGPGEINYWSLLQPLFHMTSSKVPPVLPRFEFTCLSRDVQSIMEREKLSIDECLEGNILNKVEAILQHAKKVNGHQMYENVLDSMENGHMAMREAWKSLAPSEESYGETNWHIVKSELKKFANKIDTFQEKQEQERVKRLMKVHHFIRPKEKPQERVLNVIWFINRYGSDFVWELLDQDVERNRPHIVVKL
ncbi:bacillithiol biosynthesis cysteine-adding enzyme BshC [Alteribacillus iranensis]|uniref:Putative cysteine ligase BshC n=1 Tax=Alteribacillus iranensis TaxID=930128 RepID=A0A1I2AAR6_9BACI|nr:bacillithiol biosynthesis cysteine-adding enzyme BshC [Alteribacillus iranensis]SFE41134.1 bacillithiol biosynthesis cysteine-adding enzyme BshC [Alteribacillus iranensis]